jgi:tetratricopeptide (TPR) repeat protein
MMTEKPKNRYRAIGVAIITLALIALFSVASPSLAAKTDKPLDQMLREATGLFGQGEYKKALPIFRKVLKYNPEEKTALRHLLIYDMEIKEPSCRAGAAAFFEGDYKTAAAKWEQVLKHDPKDMRVRHLVNEALVLSGSNAVETLYASAGRLLERGRKKEAARELGKILEIKPDESKAQEMLEKLKPSKKEMSKLNDLYAKAADLKAEEKFDLAVETLRKVLEIDPTQDQAVSLIESARKSKFESLSGKAREDYRKGDYSKAQQKMAIILTEYPDNSELKGEIERLSEALSVINEAEKDGPDWEVINVSMFNYISPFGNPEIALAASRYALELSPDGEAAGKARQFINARIDPWKLKKQGINLGSPNLKAEDVAKNLGVVDQYLTSALNNIYERAYKRAAEECDIVLALDPKNLLALKRQGSAYYLLNDIPQAIASWKKATQVAPNDKELKGFLDMARGK